MDGINAGRKTIPFARFDKTRCAQGLECLRSGSGANGRIWAAMMSAELPEGWAWAS
jgi:hypothetical protein